MKEYRGSLTEPGKDSPYRTRTIQENLDLFSDMKNGKLPDGKCILRAKINNLSPNMNLRDPALYRIKRASHPITKDEWCISCANLNQRRLTPCNTIQMYVTTFRITPNMNDALICQGEYLCPIEVIGHMDACHTSL